MSGKEFAKTKIIGTIGPASRDRETLRKLLNEGLDVVRINSAHGTREEHRETIVSVRALEEARDVPVTILYDLAGPKIRIGTLPEKGVELRVGSTVRMIEGDEYARDSLPIDCPGFAEMVNPGSRVFINDGAIQLRIRETDPPEVLADVEIGGTVTTHKGVNLPETDIDLPALTDTDVSNLRFALKQGVDWLALSFVREAQNITPIREIMREMDIYRPVIAKIETVGAVEELDQIIDIFDGCMVARGDLGVEVPIEEVPALQKTIIRKCNTAGKPVITATQMLESMVHNNRPTRAEAADVANAIYDGTDCVMLSGETAIGNNPAVAVNVMNRIILETEKQIDYTRKELPYPSVKSIADTVSHAVFQAAIDTRASAIVTMTHSGSTPRMVSKYRPPVPVYALTPFRTIQRQLNLIWGIHPICVKECATTDEMFRQAESTLMELETVQEGDRIIVSAGVPINVPGTTNLMKVQVVGEND